MAILSQGLEEASEFLHTQHTCHKKSVTGRHRDWE